MPEDIQLKFLRTIKGLENVDMVRPGMYHLSMCSHVVLFSDNIYSLWCGIRLC